MYSAGGRRRIFFCFGNKNILVIAFLYDFIFIARNFCFYVEYKVDIVFFSCVNGALKYFYVQNLRTEFWDIFSFMSFSEAPSRILRLFTVIICEYAVCSVAARASFRLSVRFILFIASYFVNGYILEFRDRFFGFRCKLVSAALYYAFIFACEYRIVFYRAEFFYRFGNEESVIV